MDNETITLESIRKLNEDITRICKHYVVNNRMDLITDVREVIPVVQRFAMWFLETKDIGVSLEEKAYMDGEMLSMLQDINQALENDDSMLMYDALECGIAEYLRLFIPEEEIEE